MFCFVFLSFCRCDSIEKLKAQLPKIEQELKDSRKFKDFYQFTFNFAKNPGQKGLGKNPFNAHWLFLFSWLNFFSIEYCFSYRFRNGNCILEFSSPGKIQVPGPVEQIFSCKFTINKS